MSMLDRPISEFDGPVDAVRVPILPPKGECRPFQDVIVELASRLKLPAFTNADGTRKFRDYPDFVVNFQTAPNSGQGFLTGWRGEKGDKAMIGEPNPNQWEMYAKNNCVHQVHLPPEHTYMRNWNQGYNDWAVSVKLRRFGDPVMIQLVRRSAAAFSSCGTRARQTSTSSASERARRKVFRSAAILLPTAGSQRVRQTEISVWPRLPSDPMAMYHSWDSQNAWLRQIHTHNYLFVNTKTATAAGIGDGDWMWVESMHGKVRCLCRHSEAVEPGTVWTWNAIGKARGAWHLAADANESQRGFLLNHLIADELPAPTAPAAPPIPIRSPDKPAGTMCACAFTRPALTKPKKAGRSSTP